MLQRSTYSKHKRVHCLIYQSTTMPDGLMFYMYGPEMGKRHDMMPYRENGLGKILKTVLAINSKQYCIYGSSANLLRP